MKRRSFLATSFLSAAAHTPLARAAAGLAAADEAPVNASVDASLSSPSVTWTSDSRTRKQM